MGGNLRTGRRFRRRLITAISAIAMLGATAAVASADVASGFVDEVALDGLNYPTNVEFAPDGRVFVAEKGGKIKVFESVDDPNLPSVFADLSDDVHSFWDRGLLGIAVHPDYPDTPYVYALYTYGTPLDPSLKTWTTEEACPTPPGSTADGCVVSGRLTRLEAPVDPTTATVKTDLITDWCQQFPSHSVGDVIFGTDGALYVSGGDGASFGVADYGQRGGSVGPEPYLTPSNPCGDPPVPSGSAQTPPTAEGGALRAQDLRTSGDPVGLNGAVIRIDPITGAAMSDNSAHGATDENEERIVAYGLRNPYRLTVDPSDGTVYVADVGWNIWEEVDVLPNPTGEVRNFGWPCYEGGYGTGSGGTSLKQGDYDNHDLDICEDLYQAGAVTAPLFAYHHEADITGSDSCPPANPPQGTSSSISGLAFYPGGEYPGIYDGALFGTDYSRNCIWVMYRGGSGDLDPASTEVFESDAGNPVDLEIGPNGDLFYVDYLGGSVHRIRFVGDNTPPVASISPSVTSGPAPLLVELDGSGSSDADGDSIVSYQWDLDGDGLYDDATGANASETYDQGSHTIRLKVTDDRGGVGTDSVVIQASNTAPTAVIDTPSASAKWHVGEAFSFSGHATDPEEGSLPANSLSWDLILHHCENDGSCHQHVIQSFEGVSGGNFTAPDHEYPSWLELRLTAIDQYDVEDVESVELQPETVELTFATSPSGFEVSFFGVPGTAPFTETWIVGADIDLATPAVQQALGSEWNFVSWSNGGSRVQSFAAPSMDTTYTASFEGPAPTPGSPDPADEMFFYRTSGSFRYYDMTPTGGLIPIYTGTGYSKGWDSISAVDLDGDGHDEMFFYRSSDGAFRYYNMRSDGKLGSAILTGSGYSKGWDSISAVDLDGDGQDEMFFYRSTDGAFRYYDISSHASLGAPMLAGTGYSKGWDSITAVDLNGGRDEMFFYRSSDGAFRYYSMRSDGKLGSAILTGTGYSKGWDSITAVDLDGDGQDEMFFYRTTGSFRYYNVTPSAGLVPISTGNGYSQGWDSITAVGLD